MLQKTTIDFLKALKKNNNKPWFDENRTVYETAKSDFEKLVQKAIITLSKIEEDYGMLKPKDCMFRINRDVRFSKDKSPYKTNFGAGFTIGGKKSNLAGFYIHIEPGYMFVGGGLWMPDADSLKKIRQEIDYNFPAFKKIISEKKLSTHFGNLSQESKLVNPPKGYDANNVAIDYLKLKSFTIGSFIKDEDATSNNFEKQIAELFKIMHPFISFLNRAILD